MIESQLIGRHVSEFATVLGHPVVVPDRPPEGDPDYGLDRYLEYPGRGVAVLVDWNDICSCVQFFGAEKEPGYEQYAGPLLCGLAFDSTRAEVRNAIGRPVDSRDDATIVPFEILPWDWFAQDGLKIHFEYSEAKDRVLLVSVMPLPAQA